jgi:hydrogenase large subunit
MASVRSLDNALTYDWNTGISSTPDLQKITKDDGSTIIPDNGRIIRNLIHGADTVMSAITHFYALAALDYVDASFLGPVWNPTYENGTTMLPGTTIMGNGDSVVGHYVEALVMRRKCHTMSAILSGRHPHSNAIVPGGATTLPTVSDIKTFSTLLDTVRNFINTAYIPDVLSVAAVFPQLWTAGTDPGNVLAYGDFPIQTGTNPERLLLSRGVVDSTLTRIYNGDNCPTAFLTNVREYVGYSYYTYPGLLAGTGLHPHSGNTTPDVAKVNNGTHYSWLKAPRFGVSDLVCEVGPMPTMVNTVIAGNAVTVSEAADPNSGVAVAGLVGGGTYTGPGLVTAALGLAGVSAANLLSPLGRHAGRALQAKYIADAMANTGLAQPAQAWLTELTTNGLTAPVYVYAKLPKKIALGSGWAEAPRGALGHWITIDKKRVANYQCVVPTTWNHSPMSTAGANGAAESALIGDSINTATTDAVILDIMRYLHAYDFCIACAVHLVKPDGSTIAKVKWDVDGKVQKLPNDAEI